MQYIAVKSEEIIAMADYPPLHSPGSLKEYYWKFKAGLAVEPVPLIPVEIAIACFEKLKSGHLRTLRQFLQHHRTAHYFMLGGKHRSAAAVLAGKEIPALVVQNDLDIKTVLDLHDAGKLTGTIDVGKNLETTVQELDKHFTQNKGMFWTMEEKTQAMIKNGDIPAYMLEKAEPNS